LIDWCLKPTLAVFQQYCGVMQIEEQECTDAIHLCVIRKIVRQNTAITSCVDSRVESGSQPNNITSLNKFQVKYTYFFLHDA
jgi:hypothetical protein